MDKPRKAPPIIPPSSHLCCCSGQHCSLEVASFPLLPIASHVDLNAHELGKKGTRRKWRGLELAGRWSSCFSHLFPSFSTTHFHLQTISLHTSLASSTPELANKAVFWRLTNLFLPPEPVFAMESWLHRVEACPEGQ